MRTSAPTVRLTNCATPERTEDSPDVSVTSLESRSTVQIRKSGSTATENGTQVRDIHALCNISPAMKALNLAWEKERKGGGGGAGGGVAVV